MEFYEVVKEPLEEVEGYIAGTLSSQQSYIYPLLLEYMKRGGKRMRPALVLLTLGALKGEIKEGIKPAALLEMFHNFTLVHDDIEDNSLLRRGKKTMHISEGIPIAINTADALYTFVWKCFFELDIPCEKKNEIGKLFSNSFKEVVEGQALELKWYRDKIISIKENDYFNMIGGKTGSLIRGSCELGVILSTKRKFIKNFREYGMNIGIAFQIQDDVLNLIGEEEKYKKEIGGDISEGKRTLMLVHALGHLKRNESEELKRIILSNTKDKEKISRAIGLIKSCGGIEYAKNKIDLLINDAKINLEKIEDSKYKSALLALADFVKDRSH